MQDHSPLKALNEYLQHKLETTHCTGGRLECRMTGALLLTLSGQRQDGKSMLFWDLERPLKKLIDNYLNSTDPDAAVLIIDIDLSDNKFEYHHISRRELAAREHQEAIEKKKEEERRLQDMVERIRRQDTPYGRELAEKVADALQHGPLFFSHRDYCGMGLEVGTSGEYLYGEVFDGGMINVVQHFPDRADFVDWLAAQSNASMAMLDAKETWYWNNQVITRQRLEDFIRKS